MDQDKYAVFNNFVEEGHKLWFWDVNFNALFHCPENGGTATKIFGAKHTKGALYSKIFKHGDKIIAIPQLANEILTYNMLSGQVKFIPIPIKSWGNLYAEEQGRFWDGVLYQDYLFLIGYWSSKVLKFDIPHEQVAEAKDLYEGVEIPLEARFAIFKNALLVDAKIIIPDYTVNQVFILNPDNMQCERYEVDKNGDGFSDIAYDGENIWLSPRGPGAFTAWNMALGKVSFYSGYPEGYQMKGQDAISCIEYFNNKIYVMPYWANKALSIEKNGGAPAIQAETVFNGYYHGLNAPDEKGKYLFLQKGGQGKLYTYCNKDKTVLVYDPKTKGLSRCQIQVSDEDYMEFAMQSGILVEQEGSINRFIKLLVKGKGRKEEKTNYDSQGDGTAIYKKIGELIQ